MSVVVPLCLALFVVGIAAFDGHNTPPSFVSRRDSIVDEDHRVGDRVFVVRTLDADGDPITFSLGPALFQDASKYFRIDAQTGEVFLKESLEGLGGQDYYMYVKADDGHHQAKMEVSMKIIRAAHKTPFERKEELDAAPSRPRAVNNQPVHLSVPLPPDLPKTIMLPSDLTTSGNKGTSMSPTVAVLCLALLFGLGAGAIYFGLIKTRKHRGSFKKGIKCTKSSLFRDEKSQEIALPRMPLQPSWVVALEKREPVLKSTEVFSTLTDNKGEFPRHRLRFSHILGEGNFGQVWACEARVQHPSDKETTSITVAVKTLKDNASQEEKRDFLSELSIMKLLDPHPNIVTLLGCCTEKDPLFVIMEYVRFGKLQTYLRESRPTEKREDAKPSLTSLELTKFAYQVARGMEYLSSKAIIHRDLAARNVLVTDTKQCKVSDFGFARDVISNQVYERKSNRKLPVRWMAPESLFDNIFTTKTDVWSFGVLLWEIVTLGSSPYPGMDSNEVMRRVRDGYRLERPDHCKREIYNIMSYCWDAKPTQRPSFTELTHLLEKLLVSKDDYIELERFPDHAYYNVCHDLPGDHPTAAGWTENEVSS